MYKCYLLSLVSCATGTGVWRNGGCSASYVSFVVGSNAVLRLKFCAKNSSLRQAAKRYLKGGREKDILTRFYPTILCANPLK